MALIECPECANQVSDAAKACPECGFPIASTLAEHGKLQVVQGNPQGAAQHFRPTQPLKNPGLAAVLSFFFPGVGQIYNGQIGMGIVLFMLTLVLYFTVVLGLLLHLYLIFHAYKTATRINAKITSGAI